MLKSALNCGIVKYHGHWSSIFFSTDHLEFEDRKQTYGMHNSTVLDINKLFMFTMRSY